MIEHAAECRALLAAKQCEVNDLRAQVQQWTLATLDPRDENEREGGCELSATKRYQRKPSARPFTADELSSPPCRRQLKLHPEPGEHNAQSGAGLRIQSWWSGDESCDVGNSSRRRCSGGSPSPHEPVEIPKRCGTSSDSVRPLRARLVGLLASLEEETSAFRGLLATETRAHPVVDEDRPPSRAKKSG